MTNNTSKRAGIYCRISKKDPNTPKVEIQESECRRLADSLGLTVVATYTDDGISASEFKAREQWEKLLADVADGKLDVILAVEEERFTRQPMEKEMLALACVNAGVTWHTVRGGSVDPATAEGEFMSGLMGLLSRREVKRKAERQKTMNAARRAQGLPHHGPRIFGWEPDRMQVRETEAEEIRWAYSHLLSAGSVYGIVKRWNEMALPTSTGKTYWSYATVQQVLKRPRNAGYVENGKGNILPDVTGQWEPITDRDTFNAAVAILTDPKRRLTPSTENKWLGANLIFCWCGEPLRTGVGNGEKIYKCKSKVLPMMSPGKHVSVRQADMDPAIKAAIVHELMHGPSQGVETGDGSLIEMRSAQARLAQIKDAKADLLSLVTSGAVSAADVSKPLADLSRESEALDSRVAALRAASAHAAMLVEAHAALWSAERVSLDDAAEVKGQLEAAWDALPLHQQRMLLKTMLVVTVQPWKGGKSMDRVDIVAIGQDDDEVAA